MFSEGFRGVVANMLDYDIVVSSNFSLVIRVHFRTNTLWNGINPRTFQRWVK